MISEQKIREQLAHYLRNEISLDQLEDWLVRQSWNMHNDSDENAQKLVGAIELRLAEFSSGHLDEQSLRDELLPLVNKFDAQVSFGAGLPAGPGGPNNVVIGGVIRLGGLAGRVQVQPAPLPAEA